MKLRSAEPYFLLKNGLMKSYPSLKENIQCDILIIGGGITGALMAYACTQAGYHCVLIDKRTVCFGSTSASTSILQYEIDEPLFSLIEKSGKDAAVNTYRKGIESINILKKISGETGVHFSPKKSIRLASSEKDKEWLFKEYECRQKYDFRVDWINQEKLQDEFRIKGYGAILSGEAASIDAYALAHALFRHCSDKLKIFDHTTLEKVNYHKEYNKAQANGYFIEAKYIVYANGYESVSMIPEKTAKLRSTYALISEPLDLPHCFDQYIYWTTDDPYLYWRSTEDKRLIIGGGDIPFRNMLLRDLFISSKEKQLLNHFNGIAHRLKIIPDYRWAGTFGITKDNLPYIGIHPDFPRSYFALCFGGNGITFSVMAMEILLNAIEGKPNEFLKYFRFRR